MFFLNRHVDFTQQSTLIPEELELEVVNDVHDVHSLPPVVYSHCIRFLCNYHLNNVNQCLSALADLQLTISEDYFISDNINRSNSYNCLGVAYALIGNYESAAHAYHQAIEFDTRVNCASRRLSMMQKTNTVCLLTLIRLLNYRNAPECTWWMLVWNASFVLSLIFHVSIQEIV